MNIVLEKCRQVWDGHSFVVVVLQMVQLILSESFISNLILFVRPLGPVSVVRERQAAAVLLGELSRMWIFLIDATPDFSISYIFFSLCNSYQQRIKTSIILYFEHQLLQFFFSLRYNGKIICFKFVFFRRRIELLNIKTEPSEFFSPKNIKTLARINFSIQSSSTDLLGCCGERTEDTRTPITIERLFFKVGGLSHIFLVVSPFILIDRYL